MGQASEQKISRDAQICRHLGSNLAARDRLGALGTAIPLRREREFELQGRVGGQLGGGAIASQGILPGGEPYSTE
jgi:hypothetical protein